METFKVFAFLGLCTLSTVCLLIYGIDPSELFLLGAFCAGAWVTAIVSYAQYRLDLRIAYETANLDRRYAEELAHRRHIESDFVSTTQPRA